MSLTKYEAQKRARDNLVRVIYQQEQKNGNSKYTLREAEKLADERAHKVDRDKGRG